MKLRSRLGVAIATATLGALGVAGLAACSPSPTSASAALSPEATALTALGFTDTDLTTTSGGADSGDATATTPSPAPSGTAGSGNAGSGKAAKANKGRHPALRKLLIRRATVAKHVEHGSVTVQTKNGDLTIDVQRGTITAINSTTMTVKSADGFLMTWTFGDKMRVLENRDSIQPSDVKVGETVGVAGEKSGSSDTARLVVIPKQ